MLAIAGRVAEHWARSGPADQAGNLLAALSGGEPSVNETIIAGLARGWPKDRPATVDPAVEAVLGRLTTELTPQARAQLVRLVGLWGNQALDRLGAEIAASLLVTARDEKLSESRRIDAARQLVELRESDQSVARNLLALIVPGTSTELGAGLIEAVAGSKSPQVGEALADLLPTLSPSVRSRVIRVLLGRADWSPAILATLERDPALLSELALDQKQALTSHPNREIAERAKKLLAHGGGLPDPDRQQVIDRIAPLVSEGGDPARGKSCLPAAMRQVPQARSRRRPGWSRPHRHGSHSSN